MDLVVSPSTVAPAPQQGAVAPSLRAGDVVEAQVLQVLTNDIAKIAIGNSVIEVQTKVALMPGATVRLAVSNSPEGLRLTLLGGPPDANGTAAPRSTASASTLAPDTLAAGSSGASAAGAPAVTAGGTATGSTGAPASVTPTAATPSPAQAVPQNPVAIAAAAVATAVQASAARQGGLAPLLADAGVAVVVPTLPEPVRQAAERLLAVQPTLDENLSADGVQQALSRSGLFLEANLANGASGALAGADDLKAALMVLRDTLQTFLATDPTTGTGAPKMGVDPGATAAPSASDCTPNATPPPPPYRGAPTTAQPAAAPSISTDAAPRDIGKVLLNEADAALARQTLMQAASLPDHLAPSSPNDPSGPRWLFEVPFATPQGSTVAQFEIGRDGHRGSAAGGKVAWRARFSLDVEPIGPVHAQIAITGTRAAVTLWAERPETSTQLRESAPQLADALRQAELDPGDVLVRAGTPPRPREAAGSGRFLDRAS